MIKQYNIFGEIDEVEFINEEYKTIRTMKNTRYIIYEMTDPESFRSDKISSSNIVLKKSDLNFGESLGSLNEAIEEINESGKEHVDYTVLPVICKTY